MLLCNQKKRERGIITMYQTAILVILLALAVIGFGAGYVASLF